MDNIRLATGDRQKDAILEGIQSICRIFWGPSPESCIRFRTEDFLSPFVAMGLEMYTHPPNVLEKLRAVIASFPDPDSCLTALESSYVSSFISRQGGIIAPLYQSCYEFENAPLMGRSAIEMKDRFQAKGLALSKDLNEPPDHLCIELEYLYFLLQKGWVDGIHAHIEEAVAFAEKVMLPWVEPFRIKLAENQPDDFYALCAALLCGLLQRIADMVLFS